MNTQESLRKPPEEPKYPPWVTSLVVIGVAAVMWWALVTFVIIPVKDALGF